MITHKQIADKVTQVCDVLVAYLPDHALPTYAIYDDYKNNEYRDEANGVVFHIDVNLKYTDVLKAKREIFKLLKGM